MHQMRRSVQQVHARQTREQGIPMKQKQNPEELARGLIIGTMGTVSIFMVMFIWELLIDLINWGFPDNIYKKIFIIVFLLVSAYYVIKILMILYERAIINRFELFPTESMKGNFFKRYGDKK